MVISMIFLYYVHIPNTYLSNIRTFTIRGGKIIKRWIPNSCENDENLKTILRVLKFQLSLPRSSTISLLRYYLSTKPNTPTITTIFLSPPVILKIESKFKSIYIASGDLILKNLNPKFCDISKLWNPPWRMLIFSKRSILSRILYCLKF